jgi:hypothetical protein
MKYRGFSIEELTESFLYDPVEGVVRSKRTNKILGSYSDFTTLYLSKRRGHSVVQLRAAPLVWFMHYKSLPEGEIWFRDSNVLNLKISNLYVVGRGFRKTYRVSDSVPLEKTDDEAILYNPLRKYYIVKRGKKFASYMARTLEEAKFIRNEWKTDNSIQRWDFFHKKMPYYENNNYLYAKSLVNPT